MGQRAVTGGEIVLRPPFKDTDNARLAAEVDDLRRIHALSLRLTEFNSLIEVLVDVLHTAASLVDAQLGSVQLVTADGELGMVGQVGFGDSIEEKFSLVSLEDCSTCAAALKRKARVAVRDLRADPDFTEIGTALRSYGAVAVVSTPVLDKGGNVLAMFSVYWREPHEPDERELRALDLCADLAGRHVERSMAASALRDREQRQALLMRELAHRGKNLLSVVQAIAARTLCGDRSLGEARDVFIGRLQALGHTYNTLTDEAAESARFHDIVSAGLRFHNVLADIRGPAFVVPAKKAQTLALVLHELATNSAKYGALSVPTGHIKVMWDIRGSGDDACFILEWLESGGPESHPPSRKGFGTVIMTSVVGNELNCTPTLEFASEGLRYRLQCSLRHLTEAS